MLKSMRERERDRQTDRWRERGRVMDLAYLLTLNAMCSKKCATPFVSSVSNLLPASIHRPAVHVVPPWFSEATRIPLGRKLTRVSGTLYNDYRQTSWRLASINPRYNVLAHESSPVGMIKLSC